MKKIFLLVSLLLLASSASAVNLTPAQNVEWCSSVYDSAATAVNVADSVRVIVTYGGAEVHDAWYNVADAQADTANGRLCFFDQLQDIDGSGGAGVYHVSFLFYDVSLGLYENHAETYYVGLVDSTQAILDSLQRFTKATTDSLQAILDSLQRFTKATTDSLQAVIDTLQNHDNWVAQQAEVANIDGWNPITDADSLIIDLSTFNAGSTYVDSVSFLRRAGAITHTTDSVAGRFLFDGDSVIVDNSSLVVTADLGIYGDTIQAIIDSLQLLDEKFTALRDTLDIVTDSLRAVLDSIQNKANWTIGTVTDLADSAIDAASMKSNTITNSKMADGAITWSKAWDLFSNVRAGGYTAFNYIDNPCWAYDTVTSTVKGWTKTAGGGSIDIDTSIFDCGQELTFSILSGGADSVVLTSDSFYIPIGRYNYGATFRDEGTPIELNSIVILRGSTQVDSITFGGNIAAGKTADTSKSIHITTAGHHRYRLHVERPATTPNGSRTLIVTRVWFTQFPADVDYWASIAGDTVLPPIFDTITTYATDTTDIKTMAYNNPRIMTGGNLFWKGVVVDVVSSSKFTVDSDFDAPGIGVDQRSHILLTSGDRRGQARAVVSFNTNGDTVVTEAFTAVPATGDSFVVIVRQPAMLADASEAEIAAQFADTNWTRDTTGFTVGGSFGYAATHGAAATVDYEQFWYNIDTTNVDSSDIGDWFRNNIAGSASIDYGIIADSVRVALGDTAALLLRPTVAGRTLDVTAAGNAGIDWGNIENATAPNTRPHVDVQAINSSTTAADNLGEAGDGDATAGDIVIRRVDTAYVYGGYIDSIVEGDGTASFTYKAIDTANDIGVQYVGIGAYNKAGQQLGVTNSTDGNGLTLWGFTANDTIIFNITEAAGWNWATPDTVFGVTNGGADSTMGYSTVISSPSGGNECRVYGYSYDVIDTADAMKDVWAVIEMVTVNNNTCDSTITVPRQKRKLTDSNGYFQFDVVVSSCVGNAQYRVWLEWSGGISKKYQFTASGSTRRLIW